MEMKVVIVATCHRLLDRTEIITKFINDFNNSVHLSMKASKKVVEILINYTVKNIGKFSYYVLGNFS